MVRCNTSRALRGSLRRRWRTAWLLAGLLRLAITVTADGCGGGVFIFSVNTGTVLGRPLCSDRSGRFDLLNSGGLVLVVLIDSNTQIFVASGAAGACPDVTAGAEAEVRGRKDGNTITAASVHLQ